MRVTRQNNVDPFDAAGQFAVDVEAVMRKQDNELCTLFPRFIDDFLHTLFADTKAEIGEHPTGIGNRHIGKRLTDDGDLHAVLLEHFHRLKRRFVPFLVVDISAEEWEWQVFDHTSRT